MTISSGEDGEKHIREFTYSKVIAHFKESKDYSTRKGIVHTVEDPIILDFICSHGRCEDKILEVGGGSGAFLDLVLKSTSIKEVHNIELVCDAYRNQVNGCISLIGGDAMQLPFRDCSFEWVVIKNLLHHLVGITKGGSKANAEKAVEELERVCKNGGHIIVLEQYNSNRLFSSIVFYLTLFFSVFGLSLKAFGWGENVIVSFLAPGEIKKLLADSGDVEIVFEQENQLDVPRKWKYTGLMSNIGRLVMIGKAKNENRNHNEPH